MDLEVKPNLISQLSHLLARWLEASYSRLNLGVLIKNGDLKKISNILHKVIKAKNNPEIPNTKL